MTRLPIFYGWLLVAAVFVTMAIGINARTSFSLLFPPILAEFDWDRGLASGAFSFGFLVSAIITPMVGRAMDRKGPRVVVEAGVILLGSGLLLATMAENAWQIYATLGVLVGAGTNFLGYTAQSMFLPNWFVRRRGLALGIAFSGVGVGSVMLLPFLQAVIDREGWRAACWTLGIIALLILVPLNLLLIRRPEDVGLEADGARPGRQALAARRKLIVVDAAWAAREWTLRRAMRTMRFWWIALGYSCAMFAWYAVQVHQTKYLIEVGFAPMQAAWALGLVSLVAIPGQIALGHVSDRIGREWVWGIACAGFALCYLSLIALQFAPGSLLLYAAVISQGTLGYALTSVLGPIVAEIFEGPNYGAIFGTIMLASIVGGAAGPWVTGVLFDSTGSYLLPYAIAALLSAVAALAIWRAAPRQVRKVAAVPPGVDARG